MNGFSYVDLSIITVGTATMPYKLAHWFTEVGTNRRIESTSYYNNMDYNLGEVHIVPVDRKMLKLPKPYTYGLQGKVTMI
jgi:hypothetical protein